MSSVFRYTAFVPEGDDRIDTLRVLLATAKEHGLDARNVKSAKVLGGFQITDELADVLFEESAEDDETPDEAPAPKAKKKKE